MSKDSTFAISAGASSRTISGEQCPTCSGANYIATGDNRVACPTCSPASQGESLRAPYGNHGREETSHAWRWAILAFGVALLSGLIALWIAAPDAWRELLRI
jgi:ribosomal protein S27AE